MTFQFGVHNPDFPARVRRRLFVLDFDCFYQGLQDGNEVLDQVELFHGRIETLFESSITQSLRDMMGPIHE